MLKKKKKRNGRVFCKGGRLEVAESGDVYSYRFRNIGRFFRGGVVGKKKVPEPGENSSEIDDSGIGKILEITPRF